uniref:Uncharacterized protein n=1 Tax=Anopheles dirus TaxID=7168 RepID=A0A182NUX1_9DIPT
MEGAELVDSTRNPIANELRRARFGTGHARFKDSDVDVTRKDGILLLRELAAEVKNFMDFKMNAVMVSSAMRPGVLFAAGACTGMPLWRNSAGGIRGAVAQVRQRILRSSDDSWESQRQRLGRVMLEDCCGLPAVLPLGSRHSNSTNACLSRNG